MVLAAATSLLLVIDVQARLMPAIAHGDAVQANLRRLARAAELLAVPAIGTEENPAGLGGTVPELAPLVGTMVTKRYFDATREPGFHAVLGDHARTVVVGGCEAHVCVLQTVLGLLAQDRRVVLVADAVGSRRPEDRAVALERAARAGAEIVTTEMVLFEWLATCDHPRFREVLALVRRSGTEEER